MSCSPEAVPVDCEVKRPVDIDLGPHLPAGEALEGCSLSETQSLHPEQGQVADTVGTRPHSLDAILMQADQTASRLQAPTSLCLRDFFVTRKTLGWCVGQVGRAKGYDSSTMIN